MKKLLPVLLAAVMMLTSCKTEPVATVGGIEITEAEFGFYLDSIKEQMQGTELATDADWETQEIEGKKAIDVAKERAIDIAVKNAMYIEASKAAGMELDQTDRGMVSQMKNQLIAGYGGKSEYDKYLKEHGITDRFIDMMCQSSTYFNKIKYQISQNYPVSANELQQYYEAHKEELETTYMKAKHILFLTANPNNGLALTKSEIDKARRQYESVLKRVRDGEDFDALMREYSQDPGLATYPNGYVFTDGEMVKEFEDTVKNSVYDEISTCESEHGYHIIVRLPLRYEDLVTFVEDKILSEKVEERMSMWAEKYKVEVVKYEDKYMGYTGEE